MALRYPQPMSLRVRRPNGTVVTTQGTVQADVVCSDRKVEMLAEPGRGGPYDETIDAGGQLVCRKAA